MQISFQSPIGPAGKGISFVLSADALIPVETLNERLDIVAAAARRQDAFEQLRLDQQSLAANRKLLAKRQAQRNAVRIAHESKLSVVGGTRRREPDATKLDPHGIAALSQHDQAILEIEGQIAGCEERIPFWKAILRGEEPLDLEDVTPAMAAE
jgi:hypothetical protein